MYLKRLPPVSNASRNLSKFTSHWYSRIKVKSISKALQSKAGRCSHTGRVIIRTKSSVLRKVKTPVINYSLRTLEPSFVSTLNLVPFSNKLTSLIIFSSGKHTYVPALDSTKVLSLTFFRGTRTEFLKKKSMFTYTLLFIARKLKKISNLELTPGQGVQYVRSAGCSARVISTDNSQHSALVKLPSGVRKYFSLHSIVLPGASALKLKRKLRITKSGFWRSYGVKPIVRGVARNPVDHPHGGRTKAIRYPRTPWGLTTKFK